MAARRLRSRAAINADHAPTASSTRPRRAAAAPTSATIERTSPDETRQSIHLTVKAAPSKLREATSRRHAAHRQARGKKAIVDETSEDDDEDEDEDDDNEVDYDEEDAEGDDDDEVIVARRAPPPDDEDAEGDEDVDMDDALPAPPPPAVKARGAGKASAKGAEKEVPSVEAKEMAMADDASEDEELSELESQPSSSSSDEEDLGGDDDVDADDMDEDEEEEELDSAADDDTPMTGSPGGTPDLSKLTRRQRAAFETYEGELISLSNEAQKKKHLTAEEHAMRRAEMARRRKNLSEKRNEEEKMDTINRLLKKQAPKRRGRKDVDADAAADEPAATASASAFATDNPDADVDVDVPRPSPLFVRYVQTTRGARAAAPVEWLAGPAGRVFEGRGVRGKEGGGPVGRMVQEVA